MEIQYQMNGYKVLYNIYKYKGNPEDCISYRPIWSTQIIYKIRSQLTTQRLAKILHVITDRDQYGYRENLSTIDSVIKVGDYIQNVTDKSKILLMDISKAFGTENRPLLWQTLYKKDYRKTRPNKYCAAIKTHN